MRVHGKLTGHGILWRLEHPLQWNTKVVASMQSCQMAQPRLVCGLFTHTAVLHPAHGRRSVAKSKQYEHHCARSVGRSPGDFR